MEHLIKCCMNRIYIVNHIWSFSLPHDIWPWVGIERSLCCVSKIMYYYSGAVRPLVSFFGMRLLWDGGIFWNRMRPLAPGRSSADAPRRRSADEPWAQFDRWALGAVWLMSPGRSMNIEPWAQFDRWARHIFNYRAQWNGKFQRQSRVTCRKDWRKSMVILILYG